MRTFESALNRLKEFAMDIDLADILEGAKSELQSMVQVSFRKHNTLSEDAPRAAVVNLVRAYRLLRLAEGRRLSEQTFIPVFCKAAFHDGEWESALAEAEANEDSIPRFDNDDVIWCEENDHGIGQFYKEEALPLVRSAKNLLMEKFPEYANMLDWASDEAETG